MTNLKCAPDTVYLHRLCMNVKNGNFSWQRYKGGGRYYGKDIAIMPLFCSYGQIGYSVYFPYLSMPEVTYDLEMRELTIEGTDWKEYLSNGE